jgi:hypothetical protein
MQTKAIFFILLYTLFSLAYGSTIHVPADYPSIQAALISAATNDTILVAPGTYYEHISWPNTHGLKLLSEYGPDTTIVDAAGALRCITVNFGVDSNTVISGFTIRNGNMMDGGGISCIAASPCIINNIISNNSIGSGIWIDSGDPIIINNIISHNTGYDGGGISCWMFSNPIIAHNLIEHNTATSTYGSGGGISAVDAQITIEGNTIRHNTAQTGGGIYTFKTYSIIRYNSITNNTAQYGAGIRFYQSDATVNHNDIYDNGYGMSSGFMAGLINAESNWWGDATGPYHATNPGGLGDTVSDYLDFTPWMTNPHGIEELALTTTTCISLEAHPNPFTNSTDIRCQIRDDAFKTHGRNMSLSIYDACGRLVKDLGQLSVTGHQVSVQWDGSDDYGRRLGSGAYFLKYSYSEEYFIEKIVLID